MLGIILQVRMGSSRLPGKVMLPFGNTNLLGWICKWVRPLGYPLVVATTSSGNDSVIQEWCALHGIQCFRGSECDVLERYYECSLRYGFTSIVRLTGDNPFTDRAALSSLVTMFFREQLDYANNFGSLAIGCGSEVFSLEALERCHANAHSDFQREHVNEFILENQSFFKTRVSFRSDLLNDRYTIDTSDDYLRLNRLATVIQRQRNPFDWH